MRFCAHLFTQPEHTFATRRGEKKKEQSPSQRTCREKGSKIQVCGRHTNTKKVVVFYNLHYVSLANVILLVVVAAVIVAAGQRRTESINTSERLLISGKPTRVFSLIEPDKMCMDRVYRSGIAYNFTLTSCHLIRPMRYPFCVGQGSAVKQ